MYDYVLATEPLTAAQLDRIGWRSRQGIGDSANQFHYYRLSADNRIVWGGYDAVYHFGRASTPMYEDRPETYRTARRALLHHVPPTRRRPVHPPVGRRDRHQHPVLCALGVGRRGRIAYVNGFTGLGVGAARFAADVCLDLLEGSPTDAPSWRWSGSARCRSRRNRSPASASRPPAGRWTAPITTAGKRNLFLRTLDPLGLGFDS